jgi:signal transduction histidine kinase
MNNPNDLSHIENSSPSQEELLVNHEFSTKSTDPVTKKGKLILRKTEPKEVKDAWNILIVDDETDIHRVTKLMLNNYVYQNKPLQFFSAYSAEEAKKLLQERSDFVLIFLDVVMETDDAGLQLVRYIRDVLKNRLIRIILRTGQPGYAPEEGVIVEYEINDYVNKAELTRQKLITATVASLRAYADLTTIESYRYHLEELVTSRTLELQEKNCLLHNLNQNLINLNQEKNELLSIVAHDLKNPLSGILGLTELVLHSVDTISREELQEYFNLLQDNAIVMFQLINNLLNINSIESGKITIELQKVDLLPILQQLLKIYAESAKAKNITLDLQHADEANYEIIADNNTVRQILDNLISNAIKYSPLGKTVHLRVFQMQEKVRCEIQDEGQGLSAEDQAKLFGKFARLTPRPTKNEPSTGLGLFIVNKLVALLSGKVWCESELGQGATFIVELPKYSNKLD